MDTFEITLAIVKTITIYVGFIQVVPVMIWAERKGAALIQDRPGPNRVGPFGLFQPIADAVKFLFKEDPIPSNVNAFLYVLGPFLILIPASMAIAVIPFGDHFIINGKEVPLQIADLNLGFLYLLGISSLGVYGILLGGWASNNKFSLIGALRGSSQIISYEIPLGLAAANAVLFYGTLNLKQMVQHQEGLMWGFLPNWGIWYQPLGFLILLICSFAETNRLPFDLPEAEAELVGGYHTEYGSMKFASFFMAEYINLTTVSALMVTVFFGGWHLPWISDLQLLEHLGSQNFLAAVQGVTFIAKVSLFLAFFIWIRWTLPRFRYDQLMRLAWETLLPLSLANLVVTATLLYLTGTI